MKYNFKINFNLITEYLLYVFVFFLPWQTRYIYEYLTLNGKIYEYGKLSLYFCDLIFFLLFLSFIFSNKKKQKLSNTFIFSFIFLIIIFINYFFASNLDLYFYNLLRFCECVILFFILEKINFSNIKLIYVFLSSIFLGSILAIFQFINQYIPPNKYLGIAEKISYLGGSSVIENIYGRTLRSYGIFPHPNIFAGFLAVAILLMFFIYFKKQNTFNIYKKVIFWFVFGVFLYNLSITFSRSAILALICSFIVMFVLFFYKKNLKTILPVMIVSAVMIFFNFLIFKDIFNTRFENKDRLELKSYNERSALMNQSFKIISNNIIGGVGIGNYTYSVSNNIDNSMNIWDYQPVHNVYLLVLCELGIFGFIFYILIFVSQFLKCIKSNFFENYILASIIVLILVINMFDHYFWTSFSSSVLLFLIFSLRKDIIV